MAIEVFLKRPHPGVPWGFRIIGGSDSYLPIIISKVLEDSVAEQAGLEEDAVLEKINNISTSGLTHSEVNQIILAAENELLFTIRRENIENLILASLNDEDNSEISNILRQAALRSIIPEGGENTTDKEGEELDLKREFGVTMIIDNNNRLREENKIQSEQIREPLPGKKWSTFLQKPKNVIPRPKNQLPSIPKADQYRVIIKKQKKSDIVKSSFKTTTKVCEETKGEPTVCNEPEQTEINLKSQTGEESYITLEKEESATANYEEMEITEEVPQEYSRTEETDGEECNVSDLKFQADNEYSRSEEAEGQECGSPDLTVEPENIVPENTPSLEEQLAAVQKQLQELALLPSAVQETLSVVTQQLANIVGEHKPQTQESEANEETTKDETNDVTENDEERTEEENIEQAQNPDELADEISETAEMEGPQSEILSDIGEEQDLSEVTEIEINQESTAEEQRIQEEKLAKQQLEDQHILEEDESKMKKPVVRPIILPGGRKWVDPDDAVTKVKNPKMTDDKICNTLDTFSEVIVGKTKGINFLKYTPPSKNLDYLQHSEVYRLIHGMEPPVKGISLRSEKIMAEQDYYVPCGN